MADLLILGNGFDLHCGLKTRFSDFIDFELKKEAIYAFFLKLSDNLVTHKYNADAIRTPSCVLSNTKLSLSFWEVCFLTLKALHGGVYGPSFESLTADWKDVEKVIRTSLLEETGALLSIPIIFSHLYSQAHQTHLLGEGKVIDANAEWLLLNYIESNSRFPHAKFETEKSVDQARIIFYSYLFSELKDFEQSFGQYLSGQENDNQIYNQTARAFASKLCNRNTNVVVESFNYTRPAIDCVGFRNIHGTTQNPVIGIDADGVDPKDPRFKFTKASRCLMLAIQDEGLTKQDFSVITNIIIYGHSLNAQDYTYFFNILETKRIQDPSNNCEITFPYSVYLGTTREAEQTRLHDAVEDLLNSYDRWTGHPLSTVESLYFQKKYHFQEID